MRPARQCKDRPPFVRPEQVTVLFVFACVGYAGNSKVQGQAVAPNPAALPQAAQNVTPDNATAQNPAPANDLRVDLGYLGDLRSHPKNLGYYKIAVNGQPLKQSGTPFTEANINEPLSLPSSDPGADSNAFLFSLEQGNVGGKGPLLDTLLNKPLTLNSRFFHDLRGTVEVTGQPSNNRLNLAGGLEIPPLHPFSSLKYRGTTIPNWFTVGAASEQQVKSATNGGNSSRGLALYRAFIGQGFHWIATAALLKWRTVLGDLLVQEAPTFTRAQAVRQDILAKTAGANTFPSLQDTALVQAVEAQATPPASDADWQKMLRAEAQDILLPPDQPSSTLIIESSGWYTLTGSLEDSEIRANAAVSAEYTLYLSPEKGDKNWLKLRYENGRERADPTTRRNLFTLSIGTAL